MPSPQPNAPASPTATHAAEAGVAGMTVGELIRQWLHPVDDPWHLALVQRDRVWNALRVSRLLDSLLGGYPIGTLLLCRLPQETIAMGEGRAPTKVRAGTWQLLDGQQRISALVALFSDQPGFERFYLDMFGRRWWDESIATSSQLQAAASSYIRYRGTDDEEETWNPIEGRAGFLRLAGMTQWIGSDDAKVSAALERLDAVATAPSSSDQKRDALRFLEDVDHKFVRIANVDSQLSDLVDRTRKLLRVWFHEIPVHRTELETEQDILQVFERVNLEGVRIAGDDVFFAAIKTRWPNAEPCLRQVKLSVPVLDRISALRVFSRLAALADAQPDLLPLRVDRLNPPRGAAIRERLEHLTDNSAPLRRMGKVSTALVQESGLGYGLRLVTRSLFDPVFAWAACTDRLDTDPASRDDIGRLSGFLVGTTVFRYPSTFDDAWSRMTMHLALRAGVAGDPFPIEEIVHATRERWPELRSGRRRVPDSEGRQLTNSNSSLFLSIAQGLPFDLPRRTRLREEMPSGAYCEIEWDHIWPYNQRRRMRIGRQLVPGVDRVAHAGNFWALDRPLNNFLRDKLPVRKFEFLSDPTVELHMPDRWPSRDSGFLDDHELEELRAVEALLGGKRTDDEVLEGARRFAAVVDARTDRLYDRVVEVVPRMNDFAPVRDMSAAAKANAESHDVERIIVDPTALSEKLQLPAPTHTIRQIDPGRFDDNVAAVVAIADQLDLGDDLRQIIVAAREEGFRVIGARPPRDAMWRWLKFGLNDAGKQRPGLFWIIPEPGRRTLRVRFEAGNLEWLLKLPSERSRQIFGSQRDRDYIEGQADIFIAETLVPLGVCLRAAFADAQSLRDDV